MAETRWLLVAVLLVIVFVTSQGGSDPGINRVRRVIGGVATAKGEYPYLASIWSNPNYGPSEIVYGGVLVRTDWVVLTAQGFRPGYEKDIKVRLGVYDKKDANNAQACEVSKLIQHPDFNDANYYSDIMLLKLKNCRGRRSANVKPATINTDPACPAVGQNVTVVGWGWTKINDIDSSPNVPHKANLKVFGTKWSLEQLKRMEKESANVYGIKKMIFAGVKSGGISACVGDAGGPLVARCGNSEVPVGLFSTSYGCARSNSPGVYTRLSAFKDWIDKTIDWEDKKVVMQTG